MTAELVLLIPVLVLALWFVVYCTRLPATRLRIEDAAHQAARAASQARTAATAARSARSTAAAALAEAGITCQSLSVEVTGETRPGSTVTVTVSCTVGLRDPALLQVPGSTVLNTRSASPVDPYRSEALRFTNSTVPSPKRPRVEEGDDRA